MFIPAIPQESKATFYCNDGFHSLKYCPGPNEDPIKECSVQNIESTHGNDTLRCDLSCATTESMWSIVCDSWKVPLLCKDRNKGEPLFMVAETHLKHLLVVNNCLDMVVERGMFPESEEWSTLYCPAGNQTNPGHSIKTQCEITCNNAELNAMMRNGKIPNDQVTGHFQFWAFFMCLITSWVGMAVVVTVGDAICFEMLEDKPHLYGHQRLWGAVGWGSVSLVSGLLVDEFSKGKTYKDYSVLFYMMLILILMDMLVSKRLKYSQSKMSTNIMRDVGTLLKSFRVVVFLGWCIIVGLCTALIWNFLFWHLEDLAAAEEGCDYSTWIKSLQGFAMAIQCFGGELPFFFLSGWILKKIGHINAMSLVLAGFALRFFLYSILRNPWWVLPIELLNGVTFGVFYSTMASYASIVAPPGTEATIQVRGHYSWGHSPTEIDRPIFLFTGSGGGCVRGCGCVLGQFHRWNVVQQHRRQCHVQTIRHGGLDIPGGARGGPEGVRPIRGINW